MIQRIQTIYLLLVVLFSALMLFYPLAWFIGESGSLELHAFAFQTAEGAKVQSALYLGLLLLIATVLPLVNIFLYRRRMLQIRLCSIEIVLLLGVLIMEGIYYWIGRGAMAELAYHTQGLKPVCVLPILGIVFAWLAARAILRDELLVRGADRIR